MTPPIRQLRMTNTHQAYYPTGNRRRVLVIHATAGYHPSDLNWLRKGGGMVRGHLKAVSVHYYIDKAGTITQLLSEHAIAWHAGTSAWIVDGKRWTDLNSCSIGIELANTNKGADPYPVAQRDACLALSRAIVARNHIPPAQVVRHLDISPGRKTDPAGFPWQAWKAALFAGLDTPATPTLTTYRVKAFGWVEVHEGPNTSYPVALAGTCKLPPGYEFVADDDPADGWLHLADGRGFVARDDVEAI